MQKMITLFAAGIVALAPTTAIGAPGGGSGPPAPNSISPNHDTGQPMVECEDAGENAAPSNSGRTPGPGSPFQEDSVSGSHYAGEQDGINNKNTASVSQYDIACFKGPER